MRPADSSPRDTAPDRGPDPAADVAERAFVAQACPDLTPTRDYRCPMPSGRFQFRRTGARPHEPWFQVGSVDVTTTVFVTALCVLSFFVYALSPSAVFRLAVSSETFKAGDVWGLVTWPFANYAGLVSRAISTAIFWYFGSKLEELLGRRRFTALLVLMTVIPALIVVLLGYGVGGIGALSFVMFIAYAIEYPQAPMFFGIKAWMVAVFYLVLQFLEYTGARAFGYIIAVAASLLLLVTAMRAWGAADSLSMFPKLPLVDRIQTGKNKRPTPSRARGGKGTTKRTKQRRLRSVENTGTPSSPAGPAWPSGAIRQEEVDRLLEKIASSGMSSLTPEERQTLDLASKNLRDRHE